MDERAGQGLRNVLAMHGPQVTEDVARFEALLREACGELTAEADVLLGALAAKVPQSLEAADSGTATSQLFATLVDRLKDERKLAPEVAFWAVASWALALGVLTEAEVAAVPAPQRGEDLRLTIELTAEEAQAGCRKALEVQGRKGQFTFPPHCRSGQVFHVKRAGGKGSAGGAAGDLHLTVSVAAPRTEPVTPDWDLVGKVPARVLEDHLAIPVRRDADGAVVVAMADPSNLPAIDDLQMHFGRVRAVPAREMELREVLTQVAGRQRSGPAPGSEYAASSGTRAAAAAKLAGTFIPRGQMPPTYLEMGVFTTLCCCQLLGLASICYSIQVTTKWNKGDEIGALVASGRARGYANWGIVLGGLATLIGAALQILGLAAKATMEKGGIP